MNKPNKPTGLTESMLNSLCILGGTCPKCGADATFAKENQPLFTIAADEMEREMSDIRAMPCGHVVALVEP